jgi:hypothetical protein
MGKRLMDRSKIDLATRVENIDKDIEDVQARLEKAISNSPGLNDLGLSMPIIAGLARKKPEQIPRLRLK